MAIKSIVAFVSRLSKRERAVFYTTAFFVCMLFLDRLILSPIFSKIEQLDGAILIQEETIEQGLIIVTQGKRIEAESSRYAHYLSEPQAEEKEITAFLREVENIAKQSSIYLIDIKLTGKDVESVHTKYFVKLNFEAQMEGVFNFFYNITNFKKLIKLRDYKINPKKKGSSVATCSVSISKVIIPK